MKRIFTLFQTPSLPPIHAHRRRSAKLEETSFYVTSRFLFVTKETGNRPRKSAYGKNEITTSCHDALRWLSSAMCPRRRLLLPSSFTRKSITRVNGYCHRIDYCDYSQLIGLLELLFSAPIDSLGSDTAQGFSIFAHIIGSYGLFPEGFLSPITDFLATMLACKRLTGIRWKWEDRELKGQQWLT